MQLINTNNFQNHDARSARTCSAADVFVASSIDRKFLCKDLAQGSILSLEASAGLHLEYWYTVHPDDWCIQPYSRSASGCRHWWSCWAIVELHQPSVWWCKGCVVHCLNCVASYTLCIEDRIRDWSTSSEGRVSIELNWHRICRTYRVCLLYTSDAADE